MEIIFRDHKIEDETINLLIQHNTITGLINDTDNIIFDLICLKKTGKGQIVINSEKVVKEDLFMNQKRISQIKDNINFPSYIKTIEELMTIELKINNLNVKNPYKKIRDSLKIVGLNEDYVYRELRTLSSSEKKLLLIAKGLLSNPDTIVIEEPFKYLDLKQEKRLVMLLQRFKEQFNKTIILKSEDVESLYKYTNDIIIVKNKNILLSGETDDILKRVDYLKRNGISIPESIKFIYNAKKSKNVKIDYHKDIRDIIKDIYKHV